MAIVFDKYTLLYACLGMLVAASILFCIVIFIRLFVRLQVEEALQKRQPLRVKTFIPEQRAECNNIGLSKDDMTWLSQVVEDI